MLTRLFLVKYANNQIDLTREKLIIYRLLLLTEPETSL